MMGCGMFGFLKFRKGGHLPTWGALLHRVQLLAPPFRRLSAHGCAAQRQRVWHKALRSMAYCSPHLERTGREVIAAYEVNGEPFCKSCYLGGTPGRKRRDCRRKGLPRERIEQMIRDGMRTAEIARQLNVSTGTIRYYRKRVEGSGSHSRSRIAEGHLERSVNLCEQAGGA